MTEEAVTVVNFTDHPLTDAQRVQLADLMDLSLARVVDVPAHVDLQVPLVPQVRDLVASVGWDAETWQTQPVVINPPGLAPLTAVLLVELHGRLGYFPTTLSRCRIIQPASSIKLPALSIQPPKEKPRHL